MDPVAFVAAVASYDGGPGGRELRAGAARELRAGTASYVPARRAAKH
jgi:hypothetical protein